MIEANQLYDVLHDQSVQLFDIRGGWADSQNESLNVYKQAHIPHAIFLDWQSHFIELGVQFNLASVASFKEAQDSFKSLNIAKDSLIVLYDDCHHIFSGRIWWAMKYWGVENVKILNGGWRAWQSENFNALPHDRIQRNMPNKHIFQPEKQSNYRMSSLDVEKNLHDCHLIDSRGEQSYKGNQNDPRSGHIPTSIHLPFMAVLNIQTGKFKTDNELNAVFSSHINDFGSKPIVVSCEAGYSATVLLVALQKIGMSASLFDGSFAKWRQDPKRPVKQIR